ncbi:hypothetical protein B0T25DRAFT_528363 [Lasiosphaeria hispida]|uniref:Uncharacterized protein n=1 Tax=Lasiosphaeria hispida TaxID=260671 RepID=A0AAJ0HW72_9PEZI|nr:hypothetical protein B0T25DRAFT_528363 [Lasiosphaeria hispida]
MASKIASPKPLLPSEEERRQDGPIFLGSPSSTDQLIQLIRDQVARSPPVSLRFCFCWPTDHVESLREKLAQVRDISDCVSRFEYDHESNILSLTMCESRGHAFLGGNFGNIIRGKIQYFNMSACWEGVPEEVVARARRITSFYTASIQVKEKSWYQPDGSFGLLKAPAAKSTVVYEVS